MFPRRLRTEPSRSARPAPAARAARRARPSGTPNARSRPAADRPPEVSMTANHPTPARILAAALPWLLAAAPLAAQPGGPGGAAEERAAAGGVEAAAQERSFFPGVHYFESPVADLREPRMAGALIGTDLLSTASAQERPHFEFPAGDDTSLDVQGLVALGTNLPVWRPVATSRGGVLLGFQVGVHARFRLERP